MQPLGETPFGESINLYSGELSFNQVDIQLEGQGPGEQKYTCGVVLVNDSEVRVSIRPRPFEGHPGGGDELIIHIDRVTKQVRGVLYSQ